MWESFKALFPAHYFSSLCLGLFLETRVKYARRGELFFADDVLIIATFLEECIERVKIWKEGLESKGRNVNMKKTKVMASGLKLDVLHDTGKYPCAVKELDAHPSCAQNATSGSTRHVQVSKLLLKPNIQVPTFS